MAPTTAVGDWIAAQVAAHPTRIAIRFEDEAITYPAFAADCANLAAFLTAELTLDRGARVAYLGANVPELLALVFACAQTGCMFVPLNWRLAPSELDAILEDCTPAALFVEDSCIALAAALTYALPMSHRCGVRTADSRWREIISPAAKVTVAQPSPDPATPLLLVYTSGTTGDPKGAVLTQRAVQVNALNSIHTHDLTAADRVLSALPMFHVGGLNIQTTPALAVGAEVILLRRFDPALTLAAVTADRPTLSVQVPASLHALFASSRFATTDLTSLRAITTGSTDVPRAVIDTLHQRGVPVIQVYGATETGPIAIYQRIPEAYSTAGAIGRAGLHTEIRLVAADGTDCADHTPGEIWVRGEHVAERYWNQPALGDGWFRSGDIAERDAAGVYWFKDRVKNVIISGGENIYPAELERILSAAPGITEAAVIGQADGRWGAVPIAVVVRREPSLSASEVLGVFEGRVARYKIPKHVVFVETLPRTALGKVNTAALRQLIAGMI